MAVALTNIIGPKGQLIEAGQAIPDDWPDDVVASLVESGGAKDDSRPQSRRKKEG